MDPNQGDTMRGVLIFVVTALLIPAHEAGAAKQATNDFTCHDLRKAAIRMSMHSENISNRDTTRSPDGGPFRKVVLKCKDLFCETNRSDAFRMKHEPGHPDANQAGYVKYPAIDLPMEYAAMNAAATELRLLATKELCGVKAIVTPSSALVKYDTDSSFLSDTIIFGTDGRVTSWSRLNRDGSSQHIAFGTDGLPVTSR
jgi:flagellar basal body rod protein FlgC